jgi:hypothetical protein
MMGGAPGLEAGGWGLEPEAEFVAPDLGMAVTVLDPNQLHVAAALTAPPF